MCDVVHMYDGQDVFECLINAIRAKPWRGLVFGMDADVYPDWGCFVAQYIRDQKWGAGGVYVGTGDIYEEEYLIRAEYLENEFGAEFVRVRVYHHGELIRMEDVSTFGAPEVREGG